MSYEEWKAYRKGYGNESVTYIGDVHNHLISAYIEGQADAKAGIVPQH